MSFSLFLQNSSWSAPSLNSLCQHSLRAQGIQALVLDFDGVLAGADQISIAPFLQDWLEETIHQEFFLAVHSNNPPAIEAQRQAYMLKNYPAVLWMPSKPKKPDPSHILSLCQKWGLKPSQCAMVDDRLYTGGKAAYFARAKFIYINEPIVEYEKKTGLEVLYQGIRRGERFLQTAPKRKWCAREDSNL